MDIIFFKVGYTGQVTFIFFLPSKYKSAVKVFI